VAFIRYDDVKGMDGDIEFVCIHIIFKIADRFFPEKIDGHPLNCGHIDKGMFFLRMGQIGFRQYLGIKTGLCFQIFPFKFLTVDLIVLIQFQPFRGFKGGNRRYGLGGQGSSIHQEQDFFCIAGFKSR